MSVIGFINQLITWRTSQEPLSDQFWHAEDMVLDCITATGAG
jgi:hypothetical protein